MKPILPHLYKVSSTQWACSPSKDDKHILRCKFGDSALEAFRNYHGDKPIVTDKSVYLWSKSLHDFPVFDITLERLKELDITRRNKSAFY